MKTLCLIGAMLAMVVGAVHVIAGGDVVWGTEQAERAEQEIPCHGIMYLSRDGADAEVNVSHLNCEIVGAQFFFDFDPECQTASGITPGEGWSEAFEDVDNEAGTFSYAVFRFDGTYENQVLATVDFEGDTKGCCLEFDDEHVPGTKLAISEPPHQITPPQLRLTEFFCKE